jgi:hypothetical protein
MTTLEKLRDLFKRPDTWTQKVAAKSTFDFSCHPNSSQAVKWDIVGGLHLVTNGNEDEIKAAMKALSAEIPTEFQGSVVQWNDNKYRLQEDVVTLIERAIVTCQKQP